MNDDPVAVPEFPAAAMRRAVWRGVVRTAVLAVVCLALAYAALSILSFTWQNRYRDRQTQVIGRGFVVAHPGYGGGSGGGCCNRSLTRSTLLLTLTPRTAGDLRPEVNVELVTGLRGRLVRSELPELPSNPVERALQALRGPTKAATRSVLGRLPPALRATAIVELRTPLRNEAWERFLVRHGRELAAGYLDVPPIFLEPVYRPRADDAAPGWVLPLSWPEPHSFPMVAPEGETTGETTREGIVFARTLGDADDESLREFAAWAQTLEQEDERDLRMLGLPSLRTIRNVARDPRVHGFVLERAPLAEVRAYLDDPQVRSVKVVDVAFDLGLESEG